MSELMPYQTAIQNAEERFRKVSEQLSYDKESIFAMQQLTKTDFAMATANKNPRSVILALHNLAATGLTLNPAYGYAYLVPRDGAIVLDISYKGLLKIATDTGSITWGRADVVYEADEFIYHGPAGAPTHKNHNPFRKDKGEIVGVYCIAKTKEGDILTEIMDRDEIEKIRSKSSAYSRSKNGQHAPSGPWVEWFNQMAKKAIIKRAQNTWPKTETSERLQDAIQIANESEGGYNLESEEEKAYKRQQTHDAALGRWFKSVDFIKQELEKPEPDMYTIAEAWGEIPQQDQMALWLAPSKGGGIQHGRARRNQDKATCYSVGAGSMTHKNGFMSDLSTEAQSRRSKLASRHRDSETMRKASLKSPWRNGPTVKSRNAHDAYAKNVAGNSHNLRKDRKQD